MSVVGRKHGAVGVERFQQACRSARRYRSSVTSLNFCAVLSARRACRQPSRLAVPGNGFGKARVERDGIGQRTAVRRAAHPVAMIEFARPCRGSPCPACPTAATVLRAPAPPSSAPCAAGRPRGSALPRIACGDADEIAPAIAARPVRRSPRECPVPCPLTAAAMIRARSLPWISEKRASRAARNGGDGPGQFLEQRQGALVARPIDGRRTDDHGVELVRKPHDRVLARPLAGAIGRKLRFARRERRDMDEAFRAGPDGGLRQRQCAWALTRK